MARTWIEPVHAGKGRSFKQAFYDSLDYIMNPEKTEQGQYISGYEADWRTFADQAIYNKMQYDQCRGRSSRGEKDVLAYHATQSFKPGEITPEEANRLGMEFARRFTKGKHAFVVCTHTDKEHIHNHIYWDAVSLDHRKKFRNFWGSSKAVARLSDTICLENGYSVIDDPKGKGVGQSYELWLGDKKNPSHRDQLRVAVDRALAKNPSGFHAFLDELKGMGIAVERRGKSVRLKAEGWKKYVRLDSLGEDFSEQSLRKAVAGERPLPRFYKPPKKHADDGRIALLVDIQKKILEGKGAGYYRWASGFNLKQSVKTYNWLSEHKMTYDELAERSREVTDQYHRLAGKIKKTEARMTEVAVLRTHILNYIKTRETYVAYRKAGYSKRFLAEHEGEIAAHRESKKYFDQLGLAKLPSVKSLQEEYGRLLAQKKSDYSEYHRIREEMKELLTVKKNLEQILGYEKEQDQKDAQEQRENDGKGRPGTAQAR